jgi:hypothetical protein
MRAVALQLQGSRVRTCAQSGFPGPQQQQSLLPTPAHAASQRRPCCRRQNLCAAASLGDQQQHEQQQQQQQQQHPRGAVRVRALALSPTQVFPSEPRGGPGPADSGGATAAGKPAAAGSQACSGGCYLGWNTNFAARFDMGPEVGRGSYGTVHVATHRDSGRAYAVKVLRKCPGGSPPDTSAAVTPGATTGGGLSGDAGAGTPSLTAGGDEDEGCCAEPDGANLEAIEREVHAWTTVQVGRRAVEGRGNSCHNSGACGSRAASATRATVLAGTECIRA